MDKEKDKVSRSTDEPASDNPDRDSFDQAAKLEEFMDKWKRALAEAENARKRADAARLEGREQGVARAVEALAPAYDDICLAIEALRASPDSDNPLISSHLEGLNRTRLAFQDGLKTLGIREIKPKNTPFDPLLHEALQTQETDKSKPGVVLLLHRPGFALGKRLIRPAHVTVSASPSNTAKNHAQK